MPPSAKIQTLVFPLASIGCKIWCDTKVCSLTCPSGLLPFFLVSKVADDEEEKLVDKLQFSQDSFSTDLGRVPDRQSSL